MQLHSELEQKIHGGITSKKDVDALLKMGFFSGGEWRVLQPLLYNLGNHSAFVRTL